MGKINDIGIAVGAADLMGGQPIDLNTSLKDGGLNDREVLNRNQVSAAVKSLKSPILGKMLPGVDALDDLRKGIAGSIDSVTQRSLSPAPQERPKPETVKVTEVQTVAEEGYSRLAAVYDSKISDPEPVKEDKGLWNSFVERMRTSETVAKATEVLNSFKSARLEVRDWTMRKFVEPVTAFRERTGEKLNSVQEAIQGFKDGVRKRQERTFAAVGQGLKRMLEKGVGAVKNWAICTFVEPVKSLATRIVSLFNKQARKGSEKTQSSELKRSREKNSAEEIKERKAEAAAEHQDIYDEGSFRHMKIYFRRLRQEGFMKLTGDFLAGHGEEVARLKKQGSRGQKEAGGVLSHDIYLAPKKTAQGGGELG